jgi:hypothetical protein
LDTFSRDDGYHLRWTGGRRSRAPDRGCFDRSAIHASICVERYSGMGWMRFDHGKSGLLAADRTRVMDDVLNPHVTSFRPFRGEGDGCPNGSHKIAIEPGRLAMAARSNQSLLL